MANILGSPNDISQSPWGFGGDGGSVTSATTIHSASTGTCSLDQQVMLAAGQSYQCSVTIQSATATGSLFFAVYYNDYSGTYGSAVVSLTTSPQIVTFTATNPGSDGFGWFELDIADTAGAVITVTSSSMNSPSKGLPGALSLLGVGSS